MRQDIFARLEERGTSGAKYIADRRLLLEAHAALVEVTAHLRELIDFIDSHGHGLSREPMNSAIAAVGFQGTVPSSGGLSRATLELLLQDDLLQMHDDIHKVMEGRAFDMKERNRQMSGNVQCK